MRWLLPLVLFAACSKDGPKKDPESTSAPASSSTKPTQGPPPRSGAIPPLRTAPSVPSPADLPPEANPPGAPVLGGSLQEDRGVRYIDEKVGTGNPPVKGKPISVHYTGWLTDGTKFDSSVDRGDPIKFNFDGGMVIKGWDIGLSSMKVGGKRRIIIPANLAYGDGDHGPIPGGSILVFDVELMEAEN